MRADAVESRGGDVTSFDLSPVLQLPPVRIGRAIHYGVGMFAAFLAIVLAYGGIRFSLTDEWTPSHLAVGGIGTVVAVTLVFAFASTSEQATTLDVDASGLRLISKTGVVTREVKWTSRPLSVILDWTASSPQQAARGEPAMWQLKGFRPSSTYLTREA